GTARVWDAAPVGEFVPVDRRDGPVRAAPATAGVWTFAANNARLVGGPPGASVRMPAPIVALATHRFAVAVVDARGDLTLELTNSPSRSARVGATAVAFEPDGTVLAGSRDGTIR